MKKKTYLHAGAVLLAAMVGISITACGSSAALTTDHSESASSEEVETTDSSVQDSTEAASTDADDAGTAESGDYFTDRDLTQDYDEEDAIHVELADGDISADSDEGLSIDGNTVSITDAGVYVFSGTLSDGQIVVDTDDDSKVEIVLNGVSITNPDSACLYVKNADKVFVTLAEGAENALATTGTFAADGETNVDAVIFSRDDLVMKGSGALSIESTANGIVSKDDLKITGGAVTIDAEGKGLEANNSIRIAGGSYTIRAGDDAVHVDSADDEAGYYYQNGGSLVIDAGDDGIHADGEVTIDGGEITIDSCYEGLEGVDVTINDGTISIVSEDDGINAAGGSDTSGNSSVEGWHQDSFTASGDDTLTINGGEITIDAGGDGIDSNGDLYINGGVIYCSGQSGDMNGAIDYGEGGEAVITGGTLIATGYSGMAENFSDSSTQCVALVGFSPASTGTVTVTDEDGTVLLSWQPPKQYNCVYISSPDLTEGSTVTVAAGEEEQTVSLDVVVTSANVTRGMGSMGGFGGGMGGPGRGHGGPGGRSGGDQ